MNIHTNLIFGIKKILEDILISSITADTALKNILIQNPKWGSRDRKKISHAVYTILRNKIFFEHLFNTKDLKSIIENFLQIENFEFKPLDNFPFETNYSNPISFHEIGLAELGKSLWEREIVAMHTAGNIYLRINFPSLHLAKIIEEFTQKNIEFKVEKFQFTTEKEKTISFDYIELAKRINTQEFLCFKKGLCEIQDIGSQAISHFASPSESKYIIDACCGHGGKSIHLATLSNKNAEIISMDISEQKLIRLKHRKNEQHITNITTHLIQSNTTYQFKNKADLLLLDVPCTGVGTIKRQAELKYKINSTTLQHRLEIQKNILDSYESMLKPGGKLIYSSCSIFPSENIKQIENFLSQHPQYQLTDQYTLYPSIHNSDGFFMAELSKK